MTARLLRRIGAALVWSVLGSACLVLLSVFLPLLVAAGLLRGLYDAGRWLLDRVRVVDVPDGLDDVLRRRIDGGGADELGCACPVTTATVVGCLHCDWRTCEQHKGGPHLCERDAAYDWAHEWPTNRLKPTDLDGSAAEPNELLTEIYEYLESAQ